MFSILYISGLVPRLYQHLYTKLFRKEKNDMSVYFDNGVNLIPVEGKGKY